MEAEGGRFMEKHDFAEKLGFTEKLFDGFLENLCLWLLSLMLLNPFILQEHQFQSKAMAHISSNHRLARHLVVKVKIVAPGNILAFSDFLARLLRETFPAQNLEHGIVAGTYHTINDAGHELSALVCQTEALYQDTVLQIEDALHKPEPALSADALANAFKQESLPPTWEKIGVSGVSDPLAKTVATCLAEREAGNCTGFTVYPMY